MHGGPALMWTTPLKVPPRLDPVRFVCHVAIGDRAAGPARRVFGGRGMIKSELVQLITERNPHLYQRDVEHIVNTMLGEIINALSLGDRVELRGFGVFSVREREAKIGRNPRTGDAVPVDAKRVPYFKTGKDLRDKLNASRSR